VDNIPVGGTQLAFEDKEGPTITICFNGQYFSSPGGYLNPDCELAIKIEDKSSGINIAGDIGHKITLTLDGAEEKKIELTDYFQYDQDSFTSGKIRYPLQNLAEGEHRVMIKAWDNCNNSAVAESPFAVVSNEQIALHDLLNYPNPFSTDTEITFWINQPCHIDIKIFTLSGRLIRNMDHLQAETGFNSFYWDGLDQDG